MIDFLSGGKIHVLPIKYIVKLIDNFIYHINDPNAYSDYLTLPFNCDVDNQNRLIIDEKFVANTNCGKFVFEKNDIVLSINDLDIIFQDNCHFVCDKIRNFKEPLDAY